jgi:hypothetical protein
MGADYLFYVKSTGTYAPTFLRYDNSVLAIVIALHVCVPEGNIRQATM